jgi:predicted outer membrane repeat protein
VEFAFGSSGVYSLNIDGGQNLRTGTYIYVDGRQNSLNSSDSSGQNKRPSKYIWVNFSNDGATVNANDSASNSQPLNNPFNQNTSVSAVYIDGADDLNNGPINQRPWQPGVVWQPGSQVQSGLNITLVDDLDNAGISYASGVVNCSALYASGAGIYVGEGSTLTLGSEKNSTKIDSCSVERGNGGGIYLANKSKLVVAQAAISNCSSGTRDLTASKTNPWGSFGKGSAIYVEGGATAIISNSNIQNNTGTAIFMDKGEPGNYSNLQITNSTLENNVNTANKGSELNDAPWGGGAIMVGNAALLIKNSTISNNKSYGAPGGAIVVVGASAGVSHEITNTTFEGNRAFPIGEPNSAAIDGGALYVYNEDNSTGSIFDCTFTSNTCSGNGGAIHIISPLSITKTNFIDNGAGLSGGAIYINMKNSSDRVQFSGGSSTQNKCSAGQENSSQLVSGSALYVASGVLEYSSHYVHDNVSGNQVIGAAIYVADQDASIIPDPKTGAVNAEGGASKTKAADDDLVADTSASSGSNQANSQVADEGGAASADKVAPAVTDNWMQWCYNNTRQDGTKADIYKASNSTLYVSTNTASG